MSYFQAIQGYNLGDSQVSELKQILKAMGVDPNEFTKLLEN